MRERPIYVTCTHCKERFEEGTEVDILDIEEDFYGRDKVTFICPDCNEHSTSLRVG